MKGEERKVEKIIVDPPTITEIYDICISCAEGVCSRCKGGYVSRRLRFNCKCTHDKGVRDEDV